MLSPMKRHLYMNVPLRQLEILADNGKRVIIHNGVIEDLEINEELKEVFNHAHPTTFVNSPAGTAKNTACKLC